ncbi:MAG: SdrD B-like domain-containing protein [Chloroflexota bacterium]
MQMMKEQIGHRAISKAQWVRILLRMLLIISVLLGSISASIMPHVRPASAAPSTDALSATSIEPTPSVQAASVPPLALEASGEIIGNVFRDFDADGATDSGEPGVSGITVTAYTVNNTVAMSTTTNASGTYTLTGLTDTSTYRIEFTGLPSYLEPGATGTNSNTTVVFVTSPDTGVDLALQDPSDFCQNTPDLTAVCYLQPIDATSSDWLDEAAIVQVPYESGTTALDATAVNTIENEAYMNVMATYADVGSVFGLAFDNDKDIMYSAAFMKRHVPYGPGGADAIYKIANSTVITFANLNSLVAGTPAGTDNHSPNGNNYQEDDIWDVVGKNSFGDLTMSPDGSELYIVTLTDADRRLYRIDIPSDGSRPTAGDVEAFDLPSPAGCPAHGSTGVGELNYNIRPGALSYYQDKVYVGLTCTAESSQNTSDLEGYVYAFDPVSETFGSNLLTIPFDYARTQVLVLAPTAPGNFYPWTTTQLTLSTSPALNGDSANASYPMPWLMNIGFSDDGCMVLGIADRFGHLASGAYNPPEQVNGNVGGDILKACNLSGTWTLESNGNDGVNGATAGAGTSSGPGGGEFFHDESFDLDNSYHTEISNGGFAILRGREEVVLGVYDPSPEPGTLPGGANVFDSGGLIYMDTTSGSRTRSYMLFNRNDYPTMGFDKVSATGGIVINCNAAPIEIGNRVWLDSDKDGIQDPDEAIINGVTVTLHDMDDSGAQVGSTTTSGNGNYIFGGVSATNMTSGTVKSNTSYEVRISLSDGALPVNGLTTRNANGIITNDNKTDLADSDAVESSGNAVIAFSTGDAGANNHTLDFGFAPLAIGNRVWIEDDGDGNAGTGNITAAVGITVTAVAADGTPYTTNTDSNGYYTITVPANATYTVYLPTPDGYVQSDVLHQTDNDPDTGDNQNHNSTGTVVTVGTRDNYTIDFAFTPYRNNYCVESTGSGFLDMSSIPTADQTGTGSFSYPNLSLPGHGSVTIALEKTAGTHKRDTSAIDSGTKTPFWLTQGYGSGQADGLFIEPNSGTITATYTFTGPMGNFDLIMLDIDEDDVLYISATDGDGNAVTDFSGWRYVSGDMSDWDGSTPGNVAEPGIWNATNATITSIDTNDGAGDHRSFAILTPDVLLTEIQIVYPNVGVNGRHTYSTLYGTLQGRDNEVCPVRIGNRVWYDANDNGVVDGFENSYGLDGVTVELLDNGSSVISTTTTANGGYYLFTIDNSGDSLPSGDYSVRIPSSNFGNGNPLRSFKSSFIDAGDPDNDVDNDDNGPGSNTGFDVTSSPVTVQAGSEPTQTVDGDDASGNMTVDFGFAEVCATNDFGGHVWRDYDGDGVHDSNEPGFTDVTVTVYDDDGNSFTTTVNPDGSYRFDSLFATETHIRVEFSGLPSWMQSGVHGNNSGTTVQFHDAITCNANLAVQNPARYCDSPNPEVVIACYENGTGDLSNDASVNPGVVSFNYTDTGTGDPQKDFAVQTVGAVWGTANQSRSDQSAANKVYMAALAKRHVGYGLGGESAVYIMDYTNPATPTYDGYFTLEGVNGIALGSICRGGGCESTGGNTGIASDYELPDSKATPNIDLDAYDKIGTVSYGDAAMSEDDDYLWVVNLNSRTLIRVDATNPASLAVDGAAPSGLVTEYDVTANYPTCNTGTFRPWALTFSDGMGYLGGVCDGSSYVDAESGTEVIDTMDPAPDGLLMAYVLSFDPATPTAGFNTVLQFDLNYEREDDTHNSVGEWRPWTDENDVYDTYQDPNDSTSYQRDVYPQPVLSQIEFADNGDMVLGLLDRYGHQVHARNRQPVSGTSSDLNNRVNSPGDMLHACLVNGVYVMEGGTGCSVVGHDTNATVLDDDSTSTRPNHTFSDSSTDGYSGMGEWYDEDYYALASNSFDPNHAEIIHGGLLIVSGNGEVMSTLVDPGRQTYHEGVQRFSTLTGNNVLRVDADADNNHGYQITPNTNSIESFGKGSGLGEPEAICAPAPLEIGNYVWVDGDEDGVQDPSESPIQGVTVRLTDSSGVFTDTVTDAQGEYYFNVHPNSAYTLTIDLSQSQVSTYTLTSANVVTTNTTISDSVDSDATQSIAGFAVINVTTGDAGHNDHTFDFGFITETLSVSVAVEKMLNTPDPVIPGQTISFTIRITNTGSAIITTLPLTDTYSNAYLTYIGLSTSPSSDGTADSGQIVWSDLTQNAPNGFGADFGSGDVWDVVVEFAAALDTTALPNTWTVNTAQVMTHTVTDTVRIYAPTNVVLSSRDVSVENIDGDDVVVLSWSTVNENDIVGFHVLRLDEAGGDPVRLTSDEDIILAQGSSTGADYRYEDMMSDVDADHHYVLEMVMADGTHPLMDMGTVNQQPSVWTVYLPVLRK